MEKIVGLRARLGFQLTPVFKEKTQRLLRILKYETTLLEYSGICKPSKQL